MSKKKTTEDFIKEAKLVHGDRFDYGLVLYKKMKSVVVIICPTHGRVEQTPANHLRNKNGCYRCAKTNNKKDFLIKAKSLHGNKYDYSKFEFGNVKDKSIIICKKHGEFKQCVNSHLNGRACSRCSNNRKMNTKEFIKRSKKVHNKYDYSKTRYKNVKSKVEIMCPKHGSFMQSPDSHMKGFGCTSCSNFSNGESLIKEFLNIYNIEYETQKSFDGCKYNNKLCFDFYLPKTNTCIEFDGKQHYEPIEFFGGISTYLNTKKKDIIKNQFCRKNEIELMRIPYWEINNIKNIINYGIGRQVQLR